jgi:hypothetical protein
MGDEVVDDEPEGVGALADSFVDKLRDIGLAKPEKPQSEYAKAKPGQPKADWTAMKAEYCRTALTAAELGRMYGVAKGTVQEHMGKENWVQARKLFRASAVQQAIVYAGEDYGVTGGKSMQRLTTISEIALTQLENALTDGSKVSTRDSLAVLKFKHEVAMDFMALQEEPKRLLEALRTILYREVDEETAQSIFGQLLKEFSG